MATVVGPRLIDSLVSEVSTFFEGETWTFPSIIQTMDADGVPSIYFFTLALLPSATEGLTIGITLTGFELDDLGDRYAQISVVKMWSISTTDLP